MAKRTINFTKTALLNLEPPASGREDWYDAKVDGLILRVSAAGSKVFYIYRRVDGQPKRIKIGRFPDMAIEKARRTAEAYRGQIASGVDPIEERRSLRAEMTLGELFTVFMKRHAIPYKKESSRNQDQWLWDRYLSVWSARRLSRIKQRDVQQLHAQIGADAGPYGANGAMRLLRTMFNKAREWGWGGENPVSGIHWFPERSRERFLGARELPEFFRALAQETNILFRDLVLIALLTGARRANVASMRWVDLDLEGGAWTVPDTKGGGPETKILVPQAVFILRERKRAAQELEAELSQPAPPKQTERERRRRAHRATVSAAWSTWVFPGTGERGHYVEPKRAWKKLLTRAGITNLRLHDLRRTLGSWQAALGSNMVTIGKSLGHRDLSSTAIYARLDTDPVRQAMVAATSAMLEAGGAVFSTTVEPEALEPTGESS